jgi:hypothetical protein
MDSKGRVRDSRERGEQLLNEFEKIGLSGAQSPPTLGVKYQIFSAQVFEKISSPFRR